MDEAVDPNQKPHAAASFPIVGVGASAGGLAPTKELLHGLGDAPVPTAANEELRTVNDEMRECNLDATRLSDDLSNVLARNYAQGVVDTVRGGLIVLDRARKVVSINKAFQRTFAVATLEGAERSLETLESSDLPSPALQSLLERLEAQGDVNEVRLERRGIDPRVFLVGAHAIDGTNLNLLTFDDVTEAERAKAVAEQKIVAYQEQLQHVAFDAAVMEERERRRIAIGLHDQMGQVLALAQIKLTAVRGELAGEPRTAIDEAIELLKQALSDARTLIFELSPPILYDLGLKPALAWLADEFEKRHGLKVQVTDDGQDKPLADASKSVVFRAVRELLMNVLKHARVRSATVALSRSDDDCEVRVHDSGVGFDEGAAEIASVAGFGLVSVRGQIRHLGGAVSVESSPNNGTLATIRVPLQASRAPPLDGASSIERGTP